MEALDAVVAVWLVHTHTHTRANPTPEWERDPGPGGVGKSPTGNGLGVVVLAELSAGFPDRLFAHMPQTDAEDGFSSVQTEQVHMGRCVGAECLGVAFELRVAEEVEKGGTRRRVPDSHARGGLEEKDPAV